MLVLPNVRTVVSDLQLCLLSLLDVPVDDRLIEWHARHEGWSPTSRAMRASSDQVVHVVAHRTDDGTNGELAGHAVQARNRHAVQRQTLRGRLQT